MPSWFYAKNGITYGPFAPEQIRQLAASGLLLPSDLVWTGAPPEWIPAASVAELFPGQGAEALRPSAEGPVRPPRPVRYTPAEFKELYHRVLTLTIPVTVIGATLHFLHTGVNLVAYLSSSALLVVLSSLLLYRAWAQLQDGRARTTPGKAVGFRFIPFFSLYWEFVAFKGLAEDLNRYTRRQGIPAEPVSETLALWYCIVVIVGSLLSVLPLVGWVFTLPGVVLSLILLHQVKEASMAIAEAKLPPGTGTPSPAGGPGLVTAASAGLGVVGAVVQGFDLVEKMVGGGGGQGPAA